MIPTMRLDGDLGARLNALPAVLTQSLLTGALKTGAEPMRARMASGAPRAEQEIHRPDHAEGHLADHIVISVAKKVDGEAMGERQAAVAVGPAGPFWWGRFSEFGTQHEGARPFARPAFDGTANLAFDLITADLWRRLRDAAEHGFGASFASGTAAGTGTL